MDRETYNPWNLCTVTQVEEVKCVLRLLPIWLCTIMYSVVFTQMASLFVEQGAAMKTTIANFHIPPASMSSFDILSVAAFIFIYRRVLDPLLARWKKSGKGFTELERMGVGLVIAILAMIAAGLVESFRLLNHHLSQQLIIKKNDAFNHLIYILTLVLTCGLGLYRRWRLEVIVSDH
jgi:peptide/histidine transporter 3/4